MTISLSIEEQFSSVLRSVGLTPPEIVADGRLHRFDSGKPGRKSAWYVLYDDGVPAGAYGDWSTDMSETWSAELDSTWTDEDRRAHIERVRSARATAAAELVKEHEAAAVACKSIWDNARDALADNPYCQAKAVKPIGLREFHDKRTLLIPLRDAKGKLWSLQFIDAAGGKRFKTHGRTRGCYYSFGGAPSTALLIVEGYATGASVHQATGYPVAVAFNAGNLRTVATELRAKFPDVRIIVCGDLDESGTGQKAASAAANDVDGSVAQPQFEAGALIDGKAPSDFNDMARLYGLAVVQAMIEKASPASAPDPQFGESPIPLPDSLESVEPFDLDMLPDALRPWIADIAERMQCPVDYLAATAMAALGVAVGRKVGVRPKRRDDWTVIPNMWAAIVGPPGVMKSPAQAAVLKPLKRLDALAFEDFESAKAEYEREAEIEEMRRDSKKKKAAKAIAANPNALVELPDASEGEGGAPAMKRYLVHDATVEKLADICAGNPQGVGAFRDELVSLLRSLDRDGQESARGFYLTGWNGDSGYMVDRIMRGHQRIEAVCLSVIGSTQPGRIAEYLASAVKDTAANDGLVQRFGLLVWPDMPKHWVDVDRWPDADHKRQVFTLFERLANADPIASWGAEPVKGHDGVINASAAPYLRLDDAALDLFAAWRSDLENELRAGELHPALESHLSKYRKLVPGLALLLHLADDGHGAVSAAAMVKALAWAHYLRSHAVRAYGSVTKANAAGAKALLRRLRQGDVMPGFTVREVSRKCWALLSTPGDVETAVAMLIDYGWIAPHSIDTGGRPKVQYTVHPEVWK